jgi:tRNA(adenine34) deaminase
MNKQEKMELAINHAKEALNNGETPIAACIFLGDELISKAYTTEKKDERFLVHAELNALLEADKLKYEIPDRKKMQLFTTLEPCLMCYGSAMSFFIGEIYYSLKAPDDGALNLIRFENFNNDFLKFQNPRIEESILTERSKELFSEYRESLEKDSFLYQFSTSILESN